MKKKKILVVDDESHIIQIIKINLRDSDYEIIEANNGEEALQKAATLLPDLVLLDVIMPKMDGFSACAKIKEDEKTKNIPVIMLTQKGESQDIQTGKDCGASEFLTKPFSPLKLLSKIKKYLT